MAKNWACAGHLERLPVPFPGFWPLSLRGQECLPWLLGSGAGTGQLGHPSSPDSGVLEAGLLVGADPGASSWAARGRFLSFAWVRMSISVSQGGLTSVASVPLPLRSLTLLPSLSHPGWVLVLFWVPGLHWSLPCHAFSLTRIVAVVGHGRAPPVPQDTPTSRQAAPPRPAPDTRVSRDATCYAEGSVGDFSFKPQQSQERWVL